MTAFAAAASVETVWAGLDALLGLGQDVDLLDTLQAALACERARCACRRGSMLHCPSHEDRTPSLSVRAVGSRVLLHCFGGCSQRDVIDALRARGLWPAPPTRARSSSRPQSPLAEARMRIIAAARREPWARPGVRDLYLIADFIRARLVGADRLRRSAARAGDTQAVWEAFAMAADIERDGLRVEADLEGVLA